VSTLVDEWAAQGAGAIPPPSSFIHFFDGRSSMYVSPVMTYFPVSPVAPPNMTAFFFETYVKRSYRVSLCAQIKQAELPQKLQLFAFLN